MVHVYAFLVFNHHVCGTFLQKVETVPKKKTHQKNSKKHGFHHVSPEKRNMYTALKVDGAK
jgi:hypothetical protein